MIKITGKYNSAIVFSNDIESKAKAQIEEFCNMEFSKNSIIRIMPDVHTGVGCVIGMTIKNLDYIVPYMVGVDIGCGVRVVELSKDVKINLEKIDAFIRNNIPFGFDIYGEPIEKFNFKQLRCYNKLENMDRLEKSLGTLGGGNHFIEIGKDKSDSLYLVVHTGSRNLGKQVAEHYQNIAYKQIAEIIKDKKARPPKYLSYLTGGSKADYLYDMNIVQDFVLKNREIILKKICQAFNFVCKGKAIDTKHNYIDIKNNILRKGAVSANKGEMLIIPINMKEGSLICLGKGNEEWNFSAPHGAGRLLSRTEAKKTIKLDSFIDDMKGIYTSSVGKGTLDEAPSAYKPMTEILNSTKDTIEIITTIKPIYNFKG
jgi:RNA-splicing ligase RtcB